jgi:hypothetical protein
MALKEYKNWDVGKCVGRYCSSNLEYANLWEIKKKSKGRKEKNFEHYEL